MEAFFSNVGLRLAYILLFGGVGIAGVFMLITLINDFKGALKTLIGAGVVLIIILLSWAMADDTVTKVQATKYGLTEGASQFIGGMISASIVLLIIGVIVGFAGQIYTMIKR